MIPLHFHLAVMRNGKVSYSTSKSRFIPLPASANTGTGGNLFPIYSLFFINASISINSINESMNVVNQKQNVVREFFKLGGLYTKLGHVTGNDG